ncbi:MULTISPECIES: PTS sugar transporter subunit IIA [Paenibacillus]|uniref:Mannitol-specific phosphotransferase enzyme IIA component n=1 Tax=Paenibacillus campinasensis TaxID=66347 RepID=A0A268EWA8_9BACL|nr:MULTISPECIES: PTS sugar transporter subunit IIA [Paenibacillus]MUG67828.1 PTS mannitol transporter subunit IIA [Paenibacillus campinasensis]PAD77403.1 PTS mannitol transporter subunit IIA [Paenibacillus campinasensis]PAK48598.1 PTS mannitol transporter subunit IIA [Paenibacillus sp. 7541]
MSNILSKDKVILNGTAQDKTEAIRMAGELLVKAGHVSADYVDKMLEREEIASTYMGGGLAIPHGTKEAKSMVASTGLSIVRFPEGVDFGGDEPAFVVIGIAAAGGDHMEILTNVAMIFTDDESIGKVMDATTEEEILAIFEGGMGA